MTAEKNPNSKNRRNTGLIFQSFSRNDLEIETESNLQDDLSQTEINYMGTELPANSYANSILQERLNATPKSMITRPHIELTNIDSMVDKVF